MEAAALFSFTLAHDRPVVCLAQATNSMGQSEGDFGRGGAAGASLALGAVAGIARAFRDEIAP